MATSELLTTQQAADRLGLTVRRVQALIRDSRLPAQRVGRDWLIRAGDLDAFRKQPRKPGYPKGRPRSKAGVPGKAGREK